MTKLRYFILFLLLLPLTVAAQVKFGYLSYRTLCQELPQYVQAQKELNDLKTVYEQEATRGEEEFQRKFTDFLQGQKDFPANILQKRQAELQDLMDRGVKFRKEAERLLAEAEQSLLRDLYKKLDEAIVAVGMETGYAFILNIDDNACPFINPILGDDVSNMVRGKLGIPVILDERPADQEAATSPDGAEGSAGESADGIPVQENPMQVMPVEVERP